MTEFIEQRTPEWFAMRMGKLSASTIYEIMKRGVGRAEDSFAVSLNGYLMEKVAEKVTDQRKDIHSDAMDWGTDMEESAIIRYTKVTGNEVEDAPFVPMPEFEDWAGGSPDGIIERREDGSIKGIIEVKCPYSTVIHLESVLTGTIPKMWRTKYFAQMQMNMVCTNADYCDFISYDPRVKNDNCIVIERIYRDYVYTALLEKRLTIVIEKYKELLEKVGYKYE